ncbi:hypothetical protein, partial [Prevotella sp.]|uniref:hypothetical protein n=1 Tax=Prevotella sp. TaxID=59823 RepID=UPI003077F444
PDDHPPAGGLLHHLLTLTAHKARRLFSSTDTCRRRQLLFSEVGFPVLPGLSSPTPMRGSDRTETLFPTNCKGTAIWQDRKIIDSLFL